MTKKTFTGVAKAETRRNVKPIHLVPTKQNPFPTSRPVKSFRAQIVSDVEGVIELTVNVDRLIAVLGQRALRSKGGKAVEASGLIEARVVSKKVLAEREVEIKQYHTPAHFDIVDL